MKIWLLENGEKTGPFESFVLRERIDNGEIPPDTQAWFTGADGWMDIDQVPIFSYLYENREEQQSELVEEPEPEMPEVMPTEAFELLHQPPPMCLIRRFFARVYDISLYLTLVLLITQDASVLMFGSAGMWWHLALGVGYVLLDALMLHLWGRTPGKWLLDIQVGDFFGRKLALGASVMRALRVWVLGWGMWLIVPVAIAISGLMAWRLKYMLWDLPRRYRITCGPLKFLLFFRYFSGIVCLQIIMVLGMSENLASQMQELSNTMWQEAIHKK